MEVNRHQNYSVIIILQNNFHVPQKKESHTGLERHEGE